MTFGLNSDCESTFYHIIIFLILPGIMKKDRKYEKLTKTADGRRTLLDAKNPHGIIPRLYGYSIFYVKKPIYFAKTNFITIISMYMYEYKKWKPQNVTILPRR